MTVRSKRLMNLLPWAYPQGQLHLNAALSRGSVLLGSASRCTRDTLVRLCQKNSWRPISYFFLSMYFFTLTRSWRWVHHRTRCSQRSSSTPSAPWWTSSSRSRSWSRCRPWSQCPSTAQLEIQLQVKLLKVKVMIPEVACLRQHHIPWRKRMLVSLFMFQFFHVSFSSVIFVHNCQGQEI